MAISIANSKLQKPLLNVALANVALSKKLFCNIPIVRQDPASFLENRQKYFWKVTINLHRRFRRIFLP